MTNDKNCNCSGGCKCGDNCQCTEDNKCCPECTCYMHKDKKTEPKTDNSGAADD